MPDSLGRNRKNEYRADETRSAQLPKNAPHASNPREPHDRTRPDKRGIASNAGAAQYKSPAGSAVIRPLRQAGRVYEPNLKSSDTSSNARPAPSYTNYTNTGAQSAGVHTNTGAQSAGVHTNTGAYRSSAARIGTVSSTGKYANTGAYGNNIYTNPPPKSGNQSKNSSLRSIQPTHTGQSVPNPLRRSGYVQPVTVRGEIARPTRLEGLSTRRKKSPKRRRNLTALKDFCLGLVIGFVVFGTAAYFVVNAVIDMFDMF